VVAAPAVICELAHSNDIVHEYLDAGLMITNINIYQGAPSKFPCVFSEDFRDVFCRLRQLRLQMRRISDKREAQDSL
jgi:hypothetical protein